MPETTADRPVIVAAYIIYSADVLSDYEAAIDRMSPASHMPAGFREGSYRRRAREIVASRFALTEGDDQYDYGYLGDEHTPPQVRYYPAGYTDKEGTEEPAECTECLGMGTEQDAYGGHDCQHCEGRGHVAAGQGRHRKWVGGLTGAEWRIFADAYLIDLDERGMPTEYNETMGSLTAEHGRIPAIAVDNTHGWQGGNADDAEVIDSEFYISLAMSGPEPGEDGEPE